MKRIKHCLKSTDNIFIYFIIIYFKNIWHILEGKLVHKIFPKYLQTL